MHSACSAFRFLGYRLRWQTLSHVLLTVTYWTLTASAQDSTVPELCNLRNAPMYCRCDDDQVGEDATEVTCFVGMKFDGDHPVLRAFEKQPSLVSITFNTFGQEYKMNFVPKKAFQNAPLVESLKFSQNDFGSLKTHSFHNLSSLVVLTLDSNDITHLEKHSISNLPKLKKLELADNQLQKVPAHALSNLPSLTHLFLERNKIESIEDLAFADLKSVKELELSDNVIVNLTERTFKGLSHLERLDMFRNKVRRLDARVFSGTPMLVELDLKYNEISEVDPLAFDGLPQLMIIYLSFNRLRILPANMFLGAPNLVTVDLSQNQLLTLTWRTVQDLRKIDSESFDMSLTGNKFSCDCRLAWILHLENGTRNDKFRRELRHIKCEFESPGNASSSKVTRLSPKQLGCPLDYDKPEIHTKQDLAKTVLKKTQPTEFAEDGEDHEANDLEETLSRNVPHVEDEGDEEDSETTKNEVEVVLNQQKAVDKDASQSVKRRGNGASALSAVMGLQLACVALSGLHRSR